MAARRLLIIMLILLGISSVIAIALPKPDREDSPPQEPVVTGTSGATGATGSTGDAGTPEEKVEPGDAVATAEAKVDLDAKKPAEIKAKPGTRIIVSVTSEKGSEVEITGLGRTGFADQYAPAVFDLILPSEPGQFQVKAPGEKPSAVIKTST